MPHFSRGKVVWWVIVSLLASTCGFAAQRFSIPGGWLVASILVAVVAGLLRPEHPRVSRKALFGAQAVIGTMLGSSFRPEVLPDVVLHLPAIMGVLAVAIGLSLLAGIVMGRVSPIDQKTATLGTLPGGASAMLAMSVDVGADTRTVVLMQYLRMVLVVLSASAVAGILGGSSGQTAVRPPVTSVTHPWSDFALSPVIAIVGAFGARLIHVPTAAFLGPVLLGVLGSAFHLFTPVWPAIVPEIAYVIMGMYVGLLFDRASLLQAGKLLPLMLANIVVLLVGCGVSGFVFADVAGASQLSGYLATSPGGLDSVAIIAIGSGADVSLVLSVQIVRMLTVVVAGPFIVRGIAGKLHRPAPKAKRGKRQKEDTVLD